MDLIQFLSFSSGVITIISVAINIIQYRHRRNRERSLKAHLHANYNMFYQIGRNCTKVRYEDLKSEAGVYKLSSAMENIRGISDAARTNIISYSREVLNYLPTYEHPAFPGREMSDEVMLGKAPELQKKN